MGKTGVATAIVCLLAIAVLLPASSAAVAAELPDSYRRTKTGVDRGSSARAAIGGVSVMINADGTWSVKR